MSSYKIEGVENTVRIVPSKVNGNIVVGFRSVTDGLNLQIGFDPRYGLHAAYTGAFYGGEHFIVEKIKELCPYVYEVYLQNVNNTGCYFTSRTHELGLKDRTAYVHIYSTATKENLFNEGNRVTFLYTQRITIAGQPCIRAMPDNLRRTSMLIADIREKDAHAKACKQAVDALPSRLEKYDSKIAELTSTVEEQASLIRSLTARLKGHDRTAKNNVCVFGSITDNLDKLGKQINDMTSRLDTQEKTLTRYERTFTAVNKKCTEMSGRLLGLGTLITEYKAELDEQKMVTATQASMIEELKSRLAAVKSDGSSGPASGTNTEEVHRELALFFTGSKGYMKSLMYSRLADNGGQRIKSIIDGAGNGKLLAGIMTKDTGLVQEQLLPIELTVADCNGQKTVHLIEYIYCHSRHSALINDLLSGEVYKSDILAPCDTNLMLSHAMMCKHTNVIDAILIRSLLLEDFTMTIQHGKRQVPLIEYIYCHSEHSALINALFSSKNHSTDMLLNGCDADAMFTKAIEEDHTTIIDAMIEQIPRFKLIMAYCKKKASS